MAASFPSFPTRCNCSALRRAARHVSQYYDRQLAPFGLTLNQFSLLAELRYAAPDGQLTLGELAGRLVLDRTTLSRNLRPLLATGLLTRQPAGRHQQVQLTPAGQRTVEAALVAHRAAQAGFEQAFGESQAADLRQLLYAATQLTLPA